MAIILHLGAGALMLHPIQQIQAMGHQVYAVDRNPQAPGFALANGAAPIDIVDADSVTAYAREIGANAIMAVNDAGVLAAAHASQRLGLRGLAPEVAIKALDKGLMREAWQAANCAQPRFIVVEKVDDIPAAAAKIGYPLIVKPAMNWGSRGISLVQSPDELQWSIEFAAQHQRSGRFIVEAFIDGIEMNNEMLVQDGEVVILTQSDKMLHEHPRYRVDMQINYPAKISEQRLAQVDALLIAAVHALGLDNCAAHAEVMVNESGVYLIEMAARPGGGHIFGQIVEAASGVNMPQALVSILLGEPADIRPKYQRGAVYRFFMPQGSGIFQKVEGIEAAQQLEGVLDFGFHMEPGTEIKPVDSGAARPGYCVTTGATREEAIAIADRAVSLVRYVLEPVV